MLALPNKPVVLVMTAYGTIEAAVEAMKRGAFDFLQKPVNIERLEVLDPAGSQDEDPRKSR